MGRCEVVYAQNSPWLYYGSIGGAFSLLVDVCSRCFLIQVAAGSCDGFHAETFEVPVNWERDFLCLPIGPALGVELSGDVGQVIPAF